MAVDVLDGEARPSREVVVLNGLGECGDDWGKQTGMEEMHLVMDGAGWCDKVDLWHWGRW